MTEIQEILRRKIRKIESNGEIPFIELLKTAYAPELCI